MISLKKLIIFSIVIFGGGLSSLAAPYDPAKVQMLQAQRRLAAINDAGKRCEEQRACSPFIESLEADENDPRFFGFIEAASSTCVSIFNKSSGVDIAGRFKSASELRNSLQNLYPDLGEQNNNFAKRCEQSDVNDASARYRISKFYNNAERFTNATRRAVDEIFAINSLIGSNPPRCSDIAADTLPSARAQCEKLTSQCNTSGSAQLDTLSAQSQQQEEIYKTLNRQILNLENQIRILENKYKNGPAVSAQNPKQQKCESTFVERQAPIRTCTDYSWDELQSIQSIMKTLELLNISRSAILDQFPWFKSNNFFELRKTKSSKEAIRLQLESNKQDLESKIKAYSKAMSCLNGSAQISSCDIKEYREVLGTTPDVDESFSRDRLLNAAMLYSRNQSCIEESAANVNGRTEILTGFARDSVLTVLTGGLSGFALGARAAVGTVRMTNAARAAGSVVLLTNGYYASQSFVDVVRNCRGDVAVLEQLAAPDSNSACPSVNSNQAQAERKYNQCAQAAAFAALDALPFAPSIPSVAAAVGAFRGRVRSNAANARLETMAETLNLSSPNVGGGVRQASGLVSRALYTSEIAADALPYSTTLRQASTPYPRVKNSLNEYAAASPSNFQMTDIVLSSRESNGSAGVVRMAYMTGENGQKIPVAVKTYYPSQMTPEQLEREMLMEARSADICSQTGVCGRLRGVFKDAQGRWNVATDIARGDFNGPMSSATFDDLETIIQRLRTAGIDDPSDLQAFVSPEGRMLLIDAGDLSLSRISGPVAADDVALGYTIFRREQVFKAPPAMSIQYLDKLKIQNPAAWQALVRNLQNAVKNRPQTSPLLIEYLSRN